MILARSLSLIPPDPGLDQPKIGSLTLLTIYLVRDDPA
jgi:hypothetical protein